MSKFTAHQDFFGVGQEGLLTSKRGNALEHHVEPLLVQVVRDVTGLVVLAENGVELMQPARVIFAVDANLIKKRDVITAARWEVGPEILSSLINLYFVGRVFLIIEAAVQSAADKSLSPNVGWAEVHVTARAWMVWIYT